MQKKSSVAVAFGLAALLSFTLACGAVTSMIGGGGKSATDLWADVPQMEGMKKVAGDLPLPIKLAVQAMAKASTADQNGQLDDVEFIAFSSTKSSDDLKAFYTLESMQGQGWNLKDQPGCNGGSEANSGVAGNFCLFGKEEAGGKTTVLIIMAVKENDKSDMAVYFARLSGTVTKK